MFHRPCDNAFECLGKTTLSPRQVMEWSSIFYVSRQTGYTEEDRATPTRQVNTHVVDRCAYRFLMKSWTAWKHVDTRQTTKKQQRQFVAA